MVMVMIVGAVREMMMMMHSVIDIDMVSDNW